MIVLELEAIIQVMFMDSVSSGGKKLYVPKQAAFDLWLYVYDLGQTP